MKIITENTNWTQLNGAASIIMLTLLSCFSMLIPSSYDILLSGIAIGSCAISFFICKPRKKAEFKIRTIVNYIKPSPFGEGYAIKEYFIKSKHYNMVKKQWCYTLIENDSHESSNDDIDVFEILLKTYNY